MIRFNTMLEFLFNNSTYILTIVTGVIGLCIISNSIRLISKNNLLSEYKKQREKIKSFEIVANTKKIELYKKKRFFKLKNTGKDPCKMYKKIEIEDFYLSPNNNMYIDINGGIY